MPANPHALLQHAASLLRDGHQELADLVTDAAPRAARPPRRPQRARLWLVPQPPPKPRRARRRGQS